MKRPQKITFAEMRGLLIDCSNYKCSHWITISGVHRGPAQVETAGPGMAGGD